MCAARRDRVGGDRQPYLLAAVCRLVQRAVLNRRAHFTLHAHGQYADAGIQAASGATFTGHCADCLGDGIGGDWRGGKPCLSAAALIWCAVRYTLPATCLLTFLTGGLEIVLVANSIINIAVGTPLSTPMMFSARLGIATMAICPVMVSVSMAAINSLIRQVSLRADYDFLTHVYSRSGLYEALKREEAQRQTRFLTVMLLDIDYFKSINDNYGHECGDRVLAAFAREVQQVVGDDGMVARMGGEEFAVVVNTGDAQHGFALAERIRLTIAAHPFTGASKRSI